MLLIQGLVSVCINARYFVDTCIEGFKQRFPINYLYIKNFVCIFAEIETTLPKLSEFNVFQVCANCFSRILM